MMSGVQCETRIVLHARTGEVKYLIWQSNDHETVAQLLWLIAGFLLWKLKFNPRAIHMVFVVDKVALG
jgi:hypothetical protein